MVPNQLSAMALSKECPTDPSDGAIPASCNRALNPKLVAAPVGVVDQLVRPGRPATGGGVAAMDGHLVWSDRGKVAVDQVGDTSAGPWRVVVCHLRRRSPAAPPGP